MQLPIFTRNQGEIAQSSALLRALEGESTATRRAVAARVEAAYYEWVTRQTQVDLYRETLVPAARRLESLAEESYRAGKANFLIVLASQRDVQDVESQYRESLLALQIAFAELEETVGAALD
jgi:outer membrane protein TolC